MKNMNVKYVNSKGAELNLNDGAYFLNANDLRNFDWNYTFQGKPSGIGGRVKLFTRPFSKKTVNVGIRGSAEQFKARMNALHALTETDILTKKPGKLWLDGQYIICYLAVSSQINLYSSRGNFAEKSLTILAMEPFWHTETEKQTFFASSGDPLVGGKKFNLKFPYRFGTGYGNQTLYNSHYADTLSKITIYGPATNPSIIIAGNTYAATLTLLANERLEVDQVAGTITKVDASGGIYNMFDSRDKTNDIFKPIPPGNAEVQFSGDLRFDIVLVQQRSEPLWK